VLLERMARQGKNSPGNEKEARSSAIHVCNENLRNKLAVANASTHDGSGCGGNRSLAVNEERGAKGKP
jgi:hypothetical protein